MKFTVAGSKIVCSRIDNTVADDVVYRPVVEFDSQVETVPPHVAAKLTRGEIRELEHFLADRKRIQANPAEINLIEAMPELVGEVTEILRSVDCLNETMYRRLSASISQLAEALEKVRPRGKRQAAPLRGMRSSEALKQRLENIRQNL